MAFTKTLTQRNEFGTSHSGPSPLCTVRSRRVRSSERPPKSWLAAVTRTVELGIGAMCISQWLTCFQIFNEHKSTTTKAVQINKVDDTESITIRVQSFRWPIHSIIKSLLVQK